MSCSRDFSRFLGTRAALSLSACTSAPLPAEQPAESPAEQPAESHASQEPPARGDVDRIAKAFPLEQLLARLRKLPRT